MPVEIRWTDPIADRDARVDIVRCAWHAAYTEIFSTAEIDAAFDGDITMGGDWTARRTAAAGTLVAQADGVVIGLVSLGILESGIGEIAALYLRPEWQGRGAGQQLWDAGLAVLEHRGLTHLEVWTLAGALARGFYEHQGCVQIGEAVVWLGTHSVPAVGYGRDLRPEPV